MIRDIDSYLRALSRIGHFKSPEVRLEGWYTADELRQIAEKLTSSVGVAASMQGSQPCDTGSSPVPSIRPSGVRQGGET